MRDERVPTALDAALVSRRWQLVLQHREYLVRIAMHRGLPPADAEDCAHEAMLRCVEFRNLDEARALEFLVATTTRLCVDRFRREARDEKAGVRLRGWYGDEPSPEERVCERAEAVWLARHATALPESQRTALVSKAEGLSCGDVAAALGVSYKSVESLLSRARAHLRAAVASTLAAVAVAFRRGPTAAQATAGMSLVALATLSLALATRPPLDAGGPPELAWRAPASERAAAPRVPPDAGARPDASAAGYAPTRSWAPRAGGPAGGPAGVGPAGGGLPLPPWSEPPQPACTEQPIPHVDPCLPLAEHPTASWTPGENLRRCLKYGVDLSRGFECNESPSPSREE